MNKVFGDCSLAGVVGFCGIGFEGCIVFNTRNFDSVFWNVFNADPSSETNGRKAAILVAISSSPIVALQSRMWLFLLLWRSTPHTKVRDRETSKISKSI